MNKEQVQKSASDEFQVKEAERKTKNKRDQEKEDIRFILNSPQGRRFVWRVLTHCKVFESVYHPSALIHHNSGRQDVGHFVMSEVVSASEEAFFKMMKEAKEL